MKVMTGKKYGKLEVQSLLRIEKYKSGQNKYIWLCKCECGNICEKHSRQLLNTQIPNCGCKKSRTTHGMKKTRLYRIWQGMKERCYGSKQYHRTYHENNIQVCDEWKESFVNFYKWAIANGYRENLSIDRINNFGNYEPSNCRWADRITQQNNTSKNVLVLNNGEVHTIAEWSRILKISPNLMRNRVRNGWYCKVTREEALEWS